MQKPTSGVVEDSTQQPNQSDVVDHARVEVDEQVAPVDVAVRARHEIKAHFPLGLVDSLEPVLHIDAW